MSLYPSDLRACDQEFFHNEDLFQPPPLVDVGLPQEVWFEGTAGGYVGYMSPWWPTPGSLLGDSGDVGVLQRISPWGAWTTPSGCNGRLGFVGYTRDQYGSPVPNCTVRCIRISTDEMVSKVTSDATGYYIATTPYSDAHVLVVNGPSIGGASVDTLLPG